MDEHGVRDIHNKNQQPDDEIDDKSGTLSSYTASASQRSTVCPFGSSHSFRVSFIAPTKMDTPRTSVSKMQTSAAFWSLAPF